MSASAVIVGSKRTNAAPAAAAAAAAAVTPASSSSAAAASDPVSTAAAAAAAASPFSRRAPAPPRRADPPSLFSAKSPDPLSLILSFALIDLPVATGQPYFPKELVRIVHEYASEASVVVQLERTDDDGLELMQSIDCSSSAAFLQFLGEHSPAELRPNTVEDDDGRVWSRIKSTAFHAHCDCCLMDAEIRFEYGKDVSRLLHAQLESHEYRMCYLDIEPNADGQPFKPERYIHEDIGLDEHNRFCIDELRKRKTAIVARGQTPVPVGLSELLKRVRTALKAGELPRGLSPRPCDWVPLFEWIRDFEENLNVFRVEHGWRSPSLGELRGQPQLSAVLVRSTNGDPVSIQGEARLWSSDQRLHVLTKPAASMMIDEEDDDDGCEAQSEVRSSGSSSSSSVASSSAPCVSSLSADDESDARAAPRQRCD